MMIKILFLASLMLASALAAEVKPLPIPAALLVQSNFDYSLTRKEFRVHFGGLGAGFASANKVSIKIYNPTGGEALSYELSEEEKDKREAFHFALDNVEAGKYEVEVCADGQCSAKTPSLHDVFTSSGTHKLSCEQKNSGTPIELNFAEPTQNDWADTSYYEQFSKKINDARSTSKATTEVYKTDYEKLHMNTNPYYKKSERIFHAAITQDLTYYKDFFDPKKVEDYCGRKNMLSLHSHIVNEDTKKVEHRFKTVNHLSEGGIQLFIRSTNGGRILLESTHKGVDIEDGTYKLLVSLCVTNKDEIESTYCANPITKRFTVAGDSMTIL